MLVKDAVGLGFRGALQTGEIVQHFIINFHGFDISRAGRGDLDGEESE